MNKGLTGRRLSSKDITPINSLVNSGFTIGTLPIYPTRGVYITQRFTWKCTDIYKFIPTYLLTFFVIYLLIIV